MIIHIAVYLVIINISKIFDTWDDKLTGLYFSFF